jgi:arylsulfatase A-like enzyme
VEEQGIDRRRFLKTAGAAGAVALGAATNPGRALGAATKRPDGPNVLVLMIDSLRHDHVGCYGLKKVLTPNIDALAKESVRFTRAFPEAMPTVPARRSLMLGRRVYPWRNWKAEKGLPPTPGWNGLTDKDTTWLSALHEHGYWTGYVTDNPFVGFTPNFAGFRRTLDHFLPISGQLGVRRPAKTISGATLDHWLPQQMRGIKRYHDGMRQYLANTGAGTDESQTCAARVYTHAIEMLAEAKKHGPFALVVDCFDPHEPWDPPRKYLDLYGDPGYRGAEPGDVLYKHADYLTPTELARLPAVYAASVTMTDAWLGRFLDAVYASGLADDTIVVLLSDHGILLGEYGWTGKPALELHPELIQVPFLLRAPGKGGGGTATGYFASPHDVGPTVLSMTGTPVPATMNGHDLSPLTAGRQPERGRPFWYGGYANHVYVRSSRWAMIGGGDNRGRSLYDLRADPGERTNVAVKHYDVMADLYEKVLADSHGTSLPYFV